VGVEKEIIMTSVQVNGAHPVLIECSGLTKRYGSKRALNNVTFSIEAGDPVAVVGPNGAGKTTLFSLICGFIAPSSGELRVLGGRAGNALHAGRFAALPQDAMLDPGFSIAYQLELFCRLQGYSRRQSREEVSRVLDLVQLSEAAKERPGSLSHGMKKRVAIAQSLMGSPELVLLDEPTAGLDPANALIIRDIVADRSGDTTFVISSHNLLELEKVCRTVIQIDKGEIKRHSLIHGEGLSDGFGEPGSLERSAVISITLAQACDGALVERIEAMEGVERVEQKGKLDVIIHYDEHLRPEFDQCLLKEISQAGRAYRQLNKGLSLEDQLYGLER
jgi:ABC-2 type transport system ATP-binding protein